MKALCLIFMVCLAVSAGENAILSSGFRIHADSHAIDGGLVRLQTQQGAIEIPAGLIVSFEQDDFSPPAAAASQPEQARLGEDSAPKLTPQELVTRAANHAGLPPGIVHSVARAESAYRPNAVSPKGAIGLMQLMPATAASLNADPNNPEQNAEAGAQYLRQLLERYDGDPHQVSKAVAAYNAGPAAVDKYNGVPPYRETIQYVNRVLRQYEKEQKTKPGADN
jgi:soluble lytic murein transglycosylase-like protein